MRWRDPFHSIADGHNRRWLVQIVKVPACETMVNNRDNAIIRAERECKDEDPARNCSEHPVAIILQWLVSHVPHT
jgi:hypothetical protein